MITDFMATKAQLAWRKKFAEKYGKKGTAKAKKHVKAHGTEGARRKMEGAEMGIKKQIKDMQMIGMSKAEIKKLLKRDTKIYINKYL